MVIGDKKPGRNKLPMGLNLQNIPILGPLHAMKSAFGSKRKPRRIDVDEEDDGVRKDASGSAESTTTRM